MYADFMSCHHFELNEKGKHKDEKNKISRKGGENVEKEFLHIKKEI